MPEAARLGDAVGHSPTMAMLIGGLIIGAAVGVAVVGTGGLAAVALIGATAAAGAGIAEVVSTMSFIPKQPSGQIITGSDNVFINGKKAARAHIDTADCDKHTPPRLLATGSGNVYINGLPAARVGDKLDCSAVIMEGARGVFIGGGTQQTDMIQPENLVPPWVHASLLVVGLGGVGLVAGWAVAIGGLAIGTLGGMTGDWAGGKVFGEGSDGQKASMLVGSLLGGYLGAKGGPGAWDFVKRVEVTPGTLGMSGGNIRLRPAISASEESQAAFDRATTAKAALPSTKEFKPKTVASDGEKTLSGWGENKPDGYARASAESVKAKSEEIGHELEPHPYDRDFEGQYHASHAEKQLSIVKPDDPIGVSKPMCSDCQNYFSKLAGATGKDQVVTDPDGTWIFYADGTVSSPD